MSTNTFLEGRSPHEVEQLRAKFTAQIKAMPSGCRVWTGGVTNSGVGKKTFTGKFFDGTDKLSARQVAWQFAGKVMPHGKNLIVTCGEPLCVNPEHLALGREYGLPKSQRQPESIKGVPPIEAVRNESAALRAMADALILLPEAQARRVICAVAALYNIEVRR